MIAALLLSALIWLGFSLLRLCGVDLRTEERLVVAPVTGLAAGSGLLYVLASAAGGLSPVVLAVMLGVCVLAAVVARLRPALPREPVGAWFLVVAGAAGAALTALNIYGVLATTPAGTVVAMEHVWADAPFHASIASSFAFADNYPPMYPVALGEPLSYPFLVDFLTGALLRWGMSMQASFVVVNILIQLALVCGVALLAYRLTESPRTAVVAAGVLFTLGNLGWLAIPGDLAEAGGVLPWLSELPWSYTGDALGDPGRERLGTGMYLGNPIFMFLLPRRSGAFGLAVGAVLLLLMLRLLGRRQAGTAVIVGVLLGLLPRVHAHTAIAMVAFVGVWLVLLPSWEGARGRSGWLRSWWRAAPVWLLAGAVALAIGLPQVIATAGHIDGFFAWWPGWTGEPHEAFREVGAATGLGRVGALGAALGTLGWFWVLNGGVLLVAAVGAWRRAETALRLWYLPFVVLWLFGNLVRTQPWEWDNSNYFHYWQVGTVVLVAPYLVRLLESRGTGGLRGGARRAAGGVAICGITLGGVLSLGYGAQQRHPLWSTEEAAFAAQVRERTPEDAVVLTSDAHSHPVLALSGRQGFAGFSGWLFTHGIDWAPYGEKLERMYAGDVATMRAEGITHVVVGPWEEGFARERGFGLPPVFEDRERFGVVHEAEPGGRRWRLLELRAP